MSKEHAYSDQAEDGTYNENETVHSFTKADEKALKAFPVGTVIESTIGLGGGTEVFIDGFTVQPFSYLDDYDISHYRKVEDES